MNAKPAQLPTDSRWKLVILEALEPVENGNLQAKLRNLDRALRRLVPSGRVLCEEGGDQTKFLTFAHIPQIPGANAAALVMAEDAGFRARVCQGQPSAATVVHIGVPDVAALHSFQVVAGSL